jgi:hypothetical protein
MHLFKYKSCEPFVHLVDILVNQRLYCATYDTLNDPVEGVFGHSIKAPDDPDADKLRHFSYEWTLHENRLKPNRICSLAGNVTNQLMWAHYTQGHKGVCFEIDCSGIQGLTPVTYFNNASHVSISEPKDYLKCKHSDWAYEEEHRIITESEHVPIEGRVRSIHLGARIDPVYIRPLFVLCDRAGVRVNMASPSVTGEITIFPLKQPLMGK